MLDVVKCSLNVKETLFEKELSLGGRGMVGSRGELVSVCVSERQAINGTSFSVALCARYTEWMGWNHGTKGGREGRVCGVSDTRSTMDAVTWPGLLS